MIKLNFHRKLFLCQEEKSISKGKKSIAAYKIQVTAKSNLDEFHFSRFFKNYTSFSPREYIIVNKPRI